MAKIGSFEVGAQGLGAMGLSSSYGRADDTESLRTIHRAIDLGITFFDTASGYGDGHNERLLGRAIAGRRDQLIIASKFTHRRSGGGALIMRATRSRPACAGSRSTISTFIISTASIRSSRSASP